MDGRYRLLPLRGCDNSVVFTAADAAVDLVVVVMEDDVKDTGDDRATLTVNIFITVNEEEEERIMVGITL